MKFSSLFKIIPAVFLIFSAVSVIITGVSFSDERMFYERRPELINLYYSLRDTSGYLTEQARGYVQFGEKPYLEAYYRETEITRTKQKIYAELEDMKAPENEILLAEKAEKHFSELGKLETEAFSLFERGERDSARVLLYSSAYIDKKAELNETLEEFRLALTERSEREEASLKSVSNAVFFIITSAALLLLSLTYVFFLSAGRRVISAAEAENAMERLAGGSVGSVITSLSEHAQHIKTSLYSLAAVIDETDVEIKKMAGEISSGMFNYRIETNKYGGNWAETLNSLNRAAETVKNQIIDFAPLAYFVVNGGSITDCNKYASEQIGMKPGDMLEEYLVNPEGSNSGNLFAPNTKTLKIKDGSEHRFSIISNYLSGDFNNIRIIWGMDIEDFEIKTDIIRRNRTDLQKIIDAFPIAMIISDTATKDIYYANTAFYALMGYISVPLYCEINERDFWSAKQNTEKSAAELESTFISGLENGDAGSVEFCYKSIRGKSVDTRLIGSEIMYGGKRCALKIIQDIGEEKLRTELLRNAAAREKEANRLKSSFLANMSHEIRTPMNAIIGFAQLALMRKTDPQDADAFRKISASAKNLLNIINDILDFSKIESQKIELSESSFLLEDIVSNAFMVASERIENKKVEMLLDISNDVPMNLYGDKTRLWQILKNLLDNSAKYTDKGSITLRIFPERTNGEKIHITFELRDTGIGMSEEQINLLFTPFSQFSDNYKYKTSGTGLGMSIVKEILQLMGGTITVESTLGSGTKMAVTIPFSFTDNRSGAVMPGTKKIPVDFSVLVVDDNQICLDITDNILSTAGFNAVCVKTSEEAFDEVKKSKTAGNPFNIIIMDYFLGPDNGIDIGKKINAMSPETKLLLVSAYTKEVEESKLLGAGFKDIIQKPIIPSHFIGKLRDTFDEYEAEPARQKFKDAAVLVCEDNALNREIAVEMLKMLGIEPDTAENGLICLELLERKKYDIILMDILMPNLDGKETTRRIRNSVQPYKDTVILALTANVMPEQIDEFMGAGMNGHIPKPIDFEILYKKLFEFLPINKRSVNIEMNPQEIISAVNKNSVFSIEGVDVKEGTARFAGNEELYKSALLRFANDRDAYHDAEGKDFKIFIHTLKGVSANLGIMKVSELAKETETLFKENKDYEANFKATMAELEKVSVLIRSTVEIDEPKQSKMAFGKKDEYYKLYNELKEALSNFDASESDRIIRKLTGTKWIGVSKQDYSGIISAVEGIDFPKALELTEKLHPAK